MSRLNEPDSRSSSRRLLLLSIFVGLAALASVTATLDDLGVTWDEPFYYEKCREQLAWLNQASRDFSQGNWSAPFSPEALSSHSTFRPLEERIYYTHPPFFKICSALTLVLFEHWLGPMGAYRLSPAIMFSLLVALLFFTVGRRYGILAGLWAAASFSLIPRVFGHAHLGASDTPITLLWFASAVSFHRALESRRWAPVFALVYGLALATKFTAFLIPLPLTIYVLLSRRFKEASWPVGIALVVSPLIMLGMIPQWWHAPLEGFLNFLEGSTARSVWASIPTYYLGKQYSFNPPWHHSLVYTLFTVPPLVLALFFYGLWRTLRRPFTDRWATHMGLHWLVFMLVMMLPGSPGYDGVRLFLPAFAFLAVISAKGFYHFVTRDLPPFLDRVPWLSYRVRALSAPLVLVVMVIPSSVVLARLHPYELCYYNSIAGGISGAHSLGMETTYWLDPVNDKACRLINDTLPDSAVVFTRNNSHFVFLQRLGKIKPSLGFSKYRFDHLLQYYRQGLFNDQDWLLSRRGTPRAELKVDGVRLLAVYKYPEDLREILAALDSSKSPESLYEMALIYQLMSKPDSSILRLKKHLEYRPRDFKASMMLVSICLDNKQPGEALEYLKRVAGSREDPQLWHRSMGMAYELLGKNEQAIASYRQALSYKKFDSFALTGVADIYFRIGKLRESAEYYALLLRNQPFDERGLFMLGMISQLEKKEEGAKNYYKKLLDVNSRHKEALVNLGLLERSAGRLSEAGELYIRALEVDSTYIPANFNLASLFLETGRPELAERHFKAVLRENPEQSDAHRALALLFLEDPSRQAEALEHFRILARLLPKEAKSIEQKYIQPLQAELAHRAGAP
ncbi:MAG TPA: tetratricopeptide repeat protein [archaeon]|nr:tetratricopeptide repeat protein [archaeon]